MGHDVRLAIYKWIMIRVNILYSSSTGFRYTGMNKLQLIMHTPIEELTGFYGWPFHEVRWMLCRAVTTRKTSYYGEPETVLYRGTTLTRVSRVPVKGRGTLNVPVEFELGTDRGTYFVYRHWDWYWQLSWFYNPSKETFSPLNVRHHWVEGLRKGAIKKGIYIPHAMERDFPHTWDEYGVPKEVELMGETRRMTGCYPITWRKDEY